MRHVNEILPAVEEKLRQLASSPPATLVEKSEEWHIFRHPDNGRLDMTHYRSGTYSHVTVPKSSVPFSIQVYWLDNDVICYEQQLIVLHTNKVAEILAS
jgi:hypothetical protein